MNEPIKEHDRDSGIKFVPMVCEGVEYDYLHVDMDGSEDLEKFAELIVKECVGIVNKIVPPGYEDYPDYRDQIEQSFRRECATEIKKHFGVEE